MSAMGGKRTLTNPTQPPGVSERLTGSIVGQVDEQDGDRRDRGEVEGMVLRPRAHRRLPHFEEGAADGDEQAEPGQQRHAGSPHAGRLRGVELFGGAVPRGEQVPCALDAEEADGELADERDNQRRPVERGAVAEEE